LIDRERVEDFLHLHRIQLALALGGFLAILVVILVLSLTVWAPQRKAAPYAVSPDFRPDEWWYPQEPLPVPGAQLYRVTPERWSAAEAERWYTVPDAATLDRINAENRAIIDRLLETVP
jgi:hypothetical protein